VIVAHSPSFDHVPDPLGRASQEPPRGLPAALGTPAPNRTEARRRRQAAVLLSLGWFASHLVVSGVRYDLWTLTAGYAVSQIGVPLVLALGCLYVALRPGQWGLGSSTANVVALALGGPLSFGLIALTSRAPPAPGAEAHPWLGVLLCSDLMLAWMSTPLFAAAFALRRAFAAGAVWRSALVGSSVGLASAVTINLHCDISDAFHLVMGHAAPVAAASAFAAVVVTRWLRA
jgi:hypothetical protein